MKRILPLLLIAFTLVSCSKDEQRTNSNSYIQYEVNGVPIKYTPSDITSGEFVSIHKVIMSGGNRYNINAQRGANDVFVSTMLSDSLIVGVYRFDSTHVTNGSGAIFTLKSAGVQSGLFFDGDYIEYNITRHNSGSVTGTFSAKFSSMAGGIPDYNDRGNTIITNGIIHNVNVIY